MKIVIVGDGKVGSALTKQLASENHDIVVIDNNKYKLQKSLESLDIMVLAGNGITIDVQKEADVPHSDLLIAVTSADEVNILCCIVARKLGCKHTIARVRNPEYSEQLYFLKDELNLSMTINPERTAAQEIFRLLQLPSFLKRDTFAKGRVEIVEIELPEHSVLCGKKLSELYHTIKANVLVCSVERGDKIVIPDGNFRLEEGDKLFVSASSKDLMTLIKCLHLSTHKIKEVIIVGGSRIAYYLSTALLASGIDVKIIENKDDRCQELAAMLPQATIIKADGSDQQVLLSEGIEQTDAVISLTNIDEENLLISMYANHLHVPKVITKINRQEYNELFRGRGIDSVISPKLLTANAIVRYVRAMDNTSGGSVLTLHHIVDDKVEAVECKVAETTKYLGKTLSEIVLKPNILIACINRKNTVMIPKGSDTLECGDTVVVVADADFVIQDLNDIFLH